MTYSLSTVLLHSNFDIETPLQIIIYCKFFRIDNNITVFLIYSHHISAITVENADTLLTLATQVEGGLLQKNVKSLQDCIEKCANAGNGVAPSPESLLTGTFGGQFCFAIDYDFA